MLRISKIAILALALVLTIVGVSVVVAGLFNNSTKATFTCNACTKYAFDFSVGVNLNDGMDSSEATLVAIALFEHEMNDKEYAVKETKSNSDGIWTVYLLWDGNHYFNVHVNATARTVEYDRCY
ncbi:MAG: hypothetical protein NWE95_07920 [Candidatus Bathyarchaeota archaeon]|nr:hypothetical protein [Candidatus Bathyarchaeota archaeon]